MGGESETKDFLRLFMVPDMGMCPRTNPDVFDPLGAIERWREQAIAADRIIASYSDRNASDAENFICGIPEW